MANSQIPHDGMIITEDITLTPGIYIVPEGIRVGADNISIVADGVTLISQHQRGVGLSAQGRNGVTIHGLSITGYAHGVHFDDCVHMRLEVVTIRGTAEIEGIDTFLNLWQPLEDVYGGAILFSNVRDSTIQGCDLQHQMHGIQLYGCERITATHNNASFNSGWGVYLSASGECIITDNQLDFCNRVYRRPDDGSIRVEADASGIVLVKGSCGSRFLRNSCLCGGDGIFIAGYQHPGDIQPCNDNLFEDNDCRLSPNNAIESTFSCGNVFRRNDCSRSNYGFWMGFSWENVLEDNLIEMNRFAGIAAEHAHDFIIKGNRVRQNAEGVRLWTRGGAVVPYWKGFEVSYRNELTDNLFEGNRVGFVGDTGAETTETCHQFNLHNNQFLDNRIGAVFGRVTKSSLIGNTFAHNVEMAVQRSPLAQIELRDNEFHGNHADLVEREL